MLENMILIDLETQDFNVKAGIYEVACLVAEEGDIVDELYLGKEIDGWVGERKYGYGFHDISGNFKYIRKFKDFINKYKYPLVAHNCPFDRKFLVYYEWIPEDYLAYCSMRAIRMEDNTLSSYSLHNLLTYYEVAIEDEHTAMSDVTNLYKILNIVKPQTWIPVGVAKPRYRKQVKPRNIADIDLDIDTTEILADEYVCFTGKSEYPRHIMQEIAIKNGAEITNNITSKTTILVVGIDAGSKLDKAQEKGLNIISDDEFMKILNLKDKNVAVS
jgi:DNA polymerase III epsilon subunit-like protein